MFADEFHFFLQYPDGQIRVWGHRGERLLNCCVMHRHTGPAPSNIVWGGIALKILGITSVFDHEICEQANQQLNELYESKKDSPEELSKKIEACKFLTNR
ncbi:hypothetical protein TNCV_1291641 [Trichonephila clavipes]|nr:hypothetical protein TNCV_1291641 [Trichonephila clavipes]